MVSITPSGPALWTLARSGDMRTDARIVASETLLSSMQTDRTIWQLQNVAALPGIVSPACLMPDGHEGYGFPIGGVAAFDPEMGGVVSPGGVGYDINCIKPGSKVLTDLGFFMPIEIMGEKLAVQARSNGFEMSMLQRRLAAATDAGGSSNQILAFMKKKSDRRMLRIRTKNGFELQCSEDHPIHAAEGMREAGKLAAGASISVSYFNGVEYARTGFEDERAMGIITKVFGYLLGDGSLTCWKGKYCIRAYGHEEDMKRMKQDLAELGINSSAVPIEREHGIQTQYGKKHFTGRSCELRIYSRELAVKLLTLGFPLGRKTDQAYRVPGWLTEAPLWLQRLFLAGFFGAELSSPSTHSKTGFYAPILAQNKNASFEESGRAFLIDIMQMLKGFGVEVTRIASRREQPNKQGEVVRLRLEIGAEEGNLLALWRSVGFEYNLKRRRMSEMACAYILGKKRLQSMRADAAAKAKELRAKGLKLAEAQRLLVREGIVNARFVERHYYENRAGQRITLDFDSFEKFCRKCEEQLAGHGALLDEVSSVEQIPYDGEVYDLNVEDAHRFFADGILVSNCGVRLILTDLEEKDLAPKKRELVELLFKNVPSGVGVKGKVRLKEHELEQAVTRGVPWAIEQGWGREDDIEACEENGCMQDADFSAVSPLARKRGLPQFGTVGAGNHFVEIQKVERIADEAVAKSFGLHEGQLVVMAHSGSRGFGHQICSDHLQTMVSAASKYGIHLPDRELCCAPLGSPEAKHYLGAMRCAVNFAFNNRQIMMHGVRETFDTIFGKGTSDSMPLLYDVCHNIAKFEEHEVDGKKKKLCVHRKGATRAFAAGRNEIPSKYRDIGQPVIIPGSMGTASYVLVGAQGAMDKTFGSTCHGAGRRMSRSKAVHTWTGESIQKGLGERNIMVRSTESELLAEEAPGAYKDVDEVVRSVEMAGLSRIVARLVPLAVVKG